MHRRLLPLLAILSACDGGGGAPDGDDPRVVETPDGPRVLLSPEDRAVRQSMALLGVRPSIDDLERARTEPGALDALVQEAVDDPRFGETVKHLYAELLHLRSYELVMPPRGPLETADRESLSRALSEEPLRLIERVVLEDRPFTEIVTADTTVLDEVGAVLWRGHAYDPGGPAIQEVAFTDGRPGAGILSTHGLWVRHPSNGRNDQRARANLIADALLCEDFLGRDVPAVGAIDLSDPVAVSRALERQDECVSCHQSLDPMAATLWTMFPSHNAGLVDVSYDAGCFPPADFCYPLRMYRPDLELAWAFYGLRSPGYYGAPVDDLGDLGQSIADDPRFATCTVRRFWSYFAQVDAEDVPLEVVSPLRDAFVASGFDAKALAAAVVTHPDFLALEAPDSAFADRVVGPLVARPFQLAQAVEDLTGFRWVADVDPFVCGTSPYGCYGPADIAQDDIFGYRAMAGGVDGARILRPTHTFTPIRELFAAALAEEAAGYVVREDFARPDRTQRRLLDRAEAANRSAETVRPQLAALHGRILGEVVDADDPAVDPTWALFEAVLARSGEPRDAWRAVLAAMLQSPDLQAY